MADIVTGTVTGQLDETANLQGQADIRRETAQAEANVRRDVQSTSGDARVNSAVGQGAIIDAVKTSAWANSDRTGTEADRVVAQDTSYFIAGQQYAFQNATSVAALKSAVDMSFANTLNAINTQGALGQAATALEGAKTAAAVALAGEKQAAATALGQALLQQAIVSDGNATRALINGIQMDTLNRLMQERQAEIIEQRADSRYWSGKYSNTQVENVSSQLNALHSQFQQATQGTVNFGTMSGNAGRNTSTNNVV